MASEIRRAHLLISGRVQGVFFRSTAKQQASRYMISGWIKNLADGNVECVIEGESASLEKFITWAKKGPTSAQVDRIDVEWKSPTNEFKEFEIRYM